MAVRVRKGWILAGMAALLVAVLLAWAWSDAGLRPLSPQSEPAFLPQAVK